MARYYCATSRMFVDSSNLVLPTPGVPVTRMLGRVRDMAATHNTTLALGPNTHSSHFSADHSKGISLVFLYHHTCLSVKNAAISVHCSQHGFTNFEFIYRDTMKKPVPEWIHSGMEWIYSGSEWIHSKPEWNHSGWILEFGVMNSVKK